MTLRLPELEAVEVEIQDSVGETNRRREPVSVRFPPGQSWPEVLADLDTSLSDEPAQLWQYYESVGVKANIAAAASGSADAVEDARRANALIAEAAARAIAAIPIESTSEEHLAVIGSVVSAFSEISAYPLYVTDDTRLLMVQTLELLVQRANAVEIRSSDPLFVKDFVVLLGNLLDSTSEGGQAAASRRRLQTAAD